MAERNGPDDAGEPVSVIQQQPNEVGELTTDTTLAAHYTPLPRDSEDSDAGKSTKKTSCKKKMAPKSKMAAKGSKTPKLKKNLQGIQKYKQALIDSMHNLTEKNKEELVRDVSRTAEVSKNFSTVLSQSYSPNNTTPNYLNKYSGQWDSVEMGVDPTRCNQDNTYQANKERSLTLWAPATTSPTDVIEAMQSMFPEPVDKLVLGVERDTRVRTTAKINIIATTEISSSYLQKMGLKIGEQRLYPKPTRPRPPPSKRGYLPNFPVAATEHDLETAATERGINIIKITPRLYKETAIKVGGWTIWGDMDSAMPDTVCFDGEEFAVLWRGRRPPTTTTTTTTTSKRTTNTVTNDNDTGRKAVAGAASGGQTDPAEPTKETTPKEPTNAKSDDDVDMTLVVSKSKKKRERKRERQAATKSTIETKNHNNTNNNNNAKRNTERQTKKDTLNRAAAREEEVFQPIARAEKLPLGKKEILFFNFPPETGSVTIKRFLETRGVVWNKCRFFCEQFKGQERRAVILETESILDALTGVHNCDARRYMHLDTPIYATGHYGEPPDQRFNDIFEALGH